MLAAQGECKQHTNFLLFSSKRLFIVCAMHRSREREGEIFWNNWQVKKSEKYFRSSSLLSIISNHGGHVEIGF